MGFWNDGPADADYGEVISLNGSNAVGNSNSVWCGPTNGAELIRSDGVSYIDFRNSFTEDFDCRFQMNGSNGFRWLTGGNGAATQKAELDSSGNFGINMTPRSDARMSVKGVSSSAEHSFFCLNSAGTNLYVHYNYASFLTAAGGAGPYNNTTASGANFRFSEATTSTVSRIFSSRRYKHDIVDNEHGLEKVLGLRSVKYKHINNEDTIFGGFIAEEVHDLGLTEFVSYNEENQPESVLYENMIGLLAKAIQELKTEIDQMRARVSAL